MKKILIPRIATTLKENFCNGDKTFYVLFPFEYELEFEEWCTQNNIGFTDQHRQDIHKTAYGVFTDFSNKDIFI